MTYLPWRRPTSLMIAALVLVSSASAVLAQEGPPQAFVIDARAGSVSGEVAMVGAVVAPIDDTSYWFSDGTDVITIVIDQPDSEAGMPLLTLISLQGEVNGDTIAVSEWAPLDIMTPAVIRTAGEAAEAFQTWVITQNSQGPTE